MSLNVILGTSFVLSLMLHILYRNTHGYTIQDLDDEYSEGFSDGVNSAAPKTNPDEDAFNEAFGSGVPPYHPDEPELGN